MKKLNKLNYNDIFDGVFFSYYNFIGFYKCGYVALYYKNTDLNNYINSFMIYSNNINKIKNEIKNEIKKHDIKELLHFSIDSLKDNGFSAEEIEKIASYINIKNDDKKEHKEINRYLLNEIKNYFIFRLVRK